MQQGRTKVKSKQKLIHVIQLCGKKKGMIYITVVKIRGVKSRTPGLRYGLGLGLRYGLGLRVRLGYGLGYPLEYSLGLRVRVKVLVRVRW